MLCLTFRVRENVQARCKDPDQRRTPSTMARLTCAFSASCCGHQQWNCQQTILLPITAHMQLSFRASYNSLTRSAGGADYALQSFFHFGMYLRRTVAYTELRVLYQHLIADVAFLTFALALSQDLRPIFVTSILFCCLSSQDAVMDDLAYTYSKCPIPKHESY